ncbi:hypothetical protein HPB51_017884 [Rhipicephalus microplus]|uniref:Uncharacterized protein n=1 Tax=Rhipicephalus microplus TaxID=6941 RepID=A0A9J6DAN6_RHIMP|nr:hypothetical protein HPB51_017884 [Rhipicephalus microplus]
MQHRLQHRAPTGRAPSFYATEPALDARTRLRRMPTDELRENVWHLFCSAFCQLQEDQLSQAWEASTGQQWLVNSRAGSMGPAPSSHVSHLDPHVSSLRSLCMYEHQGEGHHSSNFLQLPEYQPQQAQGATNDKHGCLPYHAFTGGAPSSHAREVNLEESWPSCLLITHLDRGDKCNLFRNVFLHLPQLQCVSDNDKNGHHLKTTTVEGSVYPITKQGTGAPCVPIWCTLLATLTQLKVTCTHTLGAVYFLKHLGDDMKTAGRRLGSNSEMIGKQLGDLQ